MADLHMKSGRTCKASQSTKNLHVFYTAPGQFKSLLFRFEAPQPQGAPKRCAPPEDLGRRGLVTGGTGRARPPCSQASGPKGAGPRRGGLQAPRQDPGRALEFLFSSEQSLGRPKRGGSSNGRAIRQFQCSSLGGHKTAATNTKAKTTH